MKVTHIALGGCLSAGRVRFGLTEDTGGHIGYVLGAARAQAARTDVEAVEIVTRLFDDPSLGPEFATPTQIAGPKLTIRRLGTSRRAYLSKEALAGEIAALARVYLNHLANPAHRPDIIHAHFADAAVLGRLARQAYGIPLVYTPHSLAVDKVRHAGQGLTPDMRKRIARERAALSDADAIVVSSRDEAERQILSYDTNTCGRVHRIWPGVTPPDASGAATRKARNAIDPVLNDPARPIILAIARPVVRKNLITLAETFATSEALRDRANLVVIAGHHGPGIETSPEARSVRTALERVAAEEVCRGRVAIPARHDADIVAGLYRLARLRRGVFVNVAHHEPFGLTLLEAAREGVPVVATRNGGPPDILDHLRCGICVAPMDRAEIGAAILGYLDRPEAWRSASANGLAGIGAFSWETWATRAMDVYRDAAAPPRPPRRAPRRLLACDMDGTLTGCRDAARRFAAWHETRNMPFVLSTGRSLTEARVILRDWGLPDADIFVTAVGTEIHLRGPDGRLELCGAFRAHLDRVWDRDALIEHIGRVGLTAQPDIEQRRWKLSYFGSARDAEYLSRDLRAGGLHARVIASHRRFVDVVPVGGGKAQALSFLARQFGLTQGDCIAAGDSGNDLDMLRAVGMPIVVGNALPELSARLRDCRVYRSRACFADGVLEGIAHYSDGTGPVRRIAANGR